MDPIDWEGLTPLSGDVEHQLAKLLSYFKPKQSDPTYLVLKAHLLAEDLMYEYLRSVMHRPDRLEEARLGFVQLVSLCRAHHKYVDDAWWGWTAFLKLNALRNQLAHNLNPANLQEKIVDFTTLVMNPLTKKNKEIEEEFVKLASGGAHPFMLSLVAFHIAITITLGRRSEKPEGPI